MSKIIEMLLQIGEIRGSLHLFIVAYCFQIKFTVLVLKSKACCSEFLLCTSYGGAHGVMFPSDRELAVPALLTKSPHVIDLSDFEIVMCINVFCRLSMLRWP